MDEYPEYDSTETAFELSCERAWLVQAEYDEEAQRDLYQ